MPNWIDKFIRPVVKRPSYLKNITTGALYRISDLRGNDSVQDIHTTIKVMRALAKDSQISTALSYYATDATLANSQGQVIWATPTEKKYEEVADIVNGLFRRWNISRYAKDHILELATIGNLYLPTTYMYRDPVTNFSNVTYGLDNNTIPDDTFDIMPSYKIPPEDIIHLWYKGVPEGYAMLPEEKTSQYTILPEMSCIHFSLGGLLGEYTIKGRSKDGEDKEYDIQFATPMMNSAVIPTQTLSLLEDALILASLSRTVKFVGVDCGDVGEEEEIQASLQDVKDTIEQQLSVNTNSGDAQSFVNPQSPNNLIFLPLLRGEVPVKIVDLNMAEASEQDSKLLQYYQDKKLSVLGVPKEAMNFSSNEGLGGAGAVLSQRSAIYSNKLQMLETAYMEGWRDGINKYFKARNMSGFADKYDLHMQPILTNQSTLLFDRRDSALNQASTLVTLLKDLGVDNKDAYREAIVEILSEALPQTGSDAVSWPVHLPAEGGSENDF